MNGGSLAQNRGWPKVVFGLGTGARHEEPPWLVAKALRSSPRVIRLLGRAKLVHDDAISRDSGQPSAELMFLRHGCARKSFAVGTQDRSIGCSGAHQA